MRENNPHSLREEDPHRSIVHRNMDHSAGQLGAVAGFVLETFDVAVNEEEVGGGVAEMPPANVTYAQVRVGTLIVVGGVLIHAAIDGKAEVGTEAFGFLEIEIGLRIGRLHAVGVEVVAVGDGVSIDCCGVGNALCAVEDQDGADRVFHVCEFVSTTLLSLIRMTDAIWPDGSGFGVGHEDGVSTVIVLGGDAAEAGSTSVYVGGVLVEENAAGCLLVSCDHGAGGVGEFEHAGQGGAPGIDIGQGGRGEALVLIHIHRHGLTDDAQVGLAVDAVGLSPGPIEGRQQDRDEHSNDPDHDKKFDQRKAA